MKKINLREKLTRFQDHWNPRIVAALNGQHVKLVKMKGEFVWHAHREEDELFLVLDGALTIETPSGDIRLEAGEFCVIPHGVEHRPVAENEAHVLLLEPDSTRNTGIAGGDKTVETPEWI
jgi:mannose-6-phosphate isomerase-like protein (cupin superfamily)